MPAKLSGSPLLPLGRETDFVDLAIGNDGKGVDEATVAAGKAKLLLVRIELDPLIVQHLAVAAFHPTAPAGMGNPYFSEIFLSIGFPYIG